MSKVTLNDSKNASLPVDDTEILIDGLKLLFQSSAYDEQIRRLTLAPLNWGRLQIEMFFGCAQWQSRKALELRSSFEVLAKVTHFVGNQPIDPQIVDNIIQFYQEDAISCQTSNKKDVIHINEQSIPIRYMSMTVREAYAMFTQKLIEKSSLESVSQSMFYSLCPKWVKIFTPHDVCSCIIRENYNFLIKVYILIVVADFGFISVL